MRQTLLLIFLLTSPIIAKEEDIIKKIKEIENNILRIEQGQINYKIEKDLLKETYSNNYEKINFTITFLLTIMGLFGFFGLRDITATKKEYESELNSLKILKIEFTNSIQALNNENSKIETELKSILLENKEQDRKIKFLELKDKTHNLYKERNFVSALDFANAALEIKPEDQFINDTKAKILCNLNNFEEAEIIFKKVYDISPEINSTIFNYVEVLFLNGKIDTGKKLIEKHRRILENRSGGKLFKLFSLFETYYNKNIPELEKFVFELINDSNLQLKSKYIDNWNLTEALTFIHFQKESREKEIVQNLLWFIDGQLTGKETLERLKMKLPEST